MNFRLCVFAVGLSVWGTTALAVGIDFSGGTTTNVQTVQTTGQAGGQPHSFTSTSAEWREGGVVTEFRSHSDLLFLYGPGAEAYLGPADFLNLSDSDPGGDPSVAERMTITREDGGAFNLQGIDTASTYEGLGAYAMFTPDPGSGLDPAHALFPILGPSLSLSGTRADGSVVTGTGTTKSPANWDPDDLSFSFPAVFDAAEVSFAPDVLADFSDLTSLTIRAFPGYIGAPEDEHADLIATLAAFGADPMLIHGAEQCGALGTCTLSGLGEFTFFTSIFGGRNDIRNVLISGYDIAFTDALSSTPVPVPLPAGGVLLLAALAGLAAVGRKTPT